MNIFILDENPQIAASYYNNSHTVKIILELTQMLSTAHYMLDSPFTNYLYKSTHANHPCSKWVRECYQNYNWAFIHLKALLKEYTTRYNKIHKCEQLLKWLEYNPVCKKNVDYCWINHTAFAQAMPFQYVSSNAVWSYRNYYINEKQHLAKWKTSQPYWWKSKDIVGSDSK